MFIKAYKHYKTFKQMSIVIKRITKQLRNIEHKPMPLTSLNLTRSPRSYPDAKDQYYFGI